MAPYRFFTAQELVSKSCDGACFKKYMRTSHATSTTTYTRAARILATIIAHFQCVSHPQGKFSFKHVPNIAKNSSKQCTVLLEFRTSGCCKRASDTYARVVVSKLYDVTKMQTKETRAHFSHASFGESLYSL